MWATSKVEVREGVSGQCRHKDLYCSNGGTDNDRISDNAPQIDVVKRLLEIFHEEEPSRKPHLTERSWRSKACSVLTRDREPPGKR